MIAINLAECIVRTLKFREGDRLPGHLWVLSNTKMFFIDELTRLLEEFPEDLEEPAATTPAPRMRSPGDNFCGGYHSNARGCLWQAGESKIIGEVKAYPLSKGRGMKPMCPETGATNFSAGWDIWRIP